MIGNRTFFFLLSSLTILLACFGVSCGQKSNGSDNQGSPGLLLTSSNGGSQGTGSWELYDPSSLTPIRTLAVTQGAPFPEAGAISSSRMGLAGSRAGFAFNPADGMFYAALPGAGLDGVIPPGRNISDVPGEVVVFDPKTDTLERVATIPWLYAFGADEPLEKYYTAPVISPDGRSLMLVAQSGGPPIPLPSSASSAKRTTGALVHLDIDPASADYGSFTPVYGMHEFGVGRDWSEQLDKVTTLPQFARTPSGDVIFLISKQVSFGSQAKAGRAFTLGPGDASDWSQPWVMVGTPYGAAAKAAPQAHYNATRNAFWFSRQNLGAGMATWVFEQQGPGGSVQQAAWTMWSTTIGAVNPQAIWTKFGGSKIYLLTAGTGPESSDDLDVPKIIEVSIFNEPVIRSYLYNYWTGSDNRLVPAGLTTSDGTGFFFVTATSTTTADDVTKYITNQLMIGGVTSTSAFLDADLDTLYADADLLPSRLDRYDYAGFSRTTLFEGTTTDGDLIVGAPAIGGLPSEPIYDRYVVSFAIQGGTHGHGAVIKYDRFTNDVTATPFGNSTPGMPVGHAIQLESGVLLGGTEERVSAGLRPQRSDVGVWVQNLSTRSPTMRDYSLPDADMVRNTVLRYTSAIAAPTQFARAVDGSVWATAVYNVWDPLGFIIAGTDYRTSVTGLVAFDPKTGAPTGELHLFGDSETWASGHFTGVTAHDNTLTFVSPALRLEDSGAAGERVWLVDLDDRDSNGRPANNSVLLSPDGSGAVGTAWVTPFAPTVDVDTGDFYFMTTAVGPVGSQTSELRIHRMEVGASIATSPTMTTVASGLTDLPGTPLFQASDGLFYFGTQAGRLMRFNPDDDSVTELADLTRVGTTSDCRGFISEGRAGVIMGIVADSTAIQSAVQRRAFSYTIDTQSLTSVDVTDTISDQDPFPGILPIQMPN